MKDIQPQSIKVKILEKTLPKFKMGEKKRENSVRDPQTTTREHARIQKDSNFTSLWTYLDLVTHPSEYDVLKLKKIMKHPILS